MAEEISKESDLYAPVKALLEGQGYDVKGEIGAADVVACREGEEPIIVELKTGFSLTLFHQAIERKSVTDQVYVAVPRQKGKVWYRNFKSNLKLCRYLGVGLITVRPKDFVCEVHVDPGVYAPRKSKKKQARLLKAFAKLSGDPNKGGSTRVGLMTAYRQDALKCLKFLTEEGPTKGAIVARITGVEKATRIMADNHYGWFEKIDTGIYALSPNAQVAQETYHDALELTQFPLPTAEK